MGRPTKLTGEVEAKILRAIRAGNDITIAARYAGVHPSTFHAWMRQGDPAGDERRYARQRRFHDNVEQARAESEVPR
jgi:transposase-like protein